MRQRNWMFVLLLVFPVIAFGQVTEELRKQPFESAVPVVQTEAYGGSNTTIVSIGAFDFDASSPGLQVNNVGYSRYLSPTGCCLNASFSIPSGSLLVRWEIIGCDSSLNSGITAALLRVNDGGGAYLIGGFISTSDTAIPGCGTFGVDISPGFTVRNFADIYYGIEFNQGSDSTGAIRLVGARVYYKRQVSPGPGAATFSDVPVGSPYFRFVEALAASGVTGGCGGGLYCPNDAVTRAQLAVFLAAALGMNYPN
jgi:hypothetical protein